MEKKITKTIEVRKHPYMFKVEVKFGTLQEMLDNAHYKVNWNGYQISIGGTFNKKLDSTRRSPLVQLAVEIPRDGYIVENRRIKLNGTGSPKGIIKSEWEGVYWYCESLFDDMLEKGLFPVRADWDGKTYIEREDGYELTDGYYY
jgi:hypothetical protein